MASFSKSSVTKEDYEAMDLIAERVNQIRGKHGFEPITIGTPTVSMFPAFPPFHTVLEAFTSHGVPSTVIRIRYHKLLP